MLYLHIGTGKTGTTSIQRALQSIDGTSLKCLSSCDGFNYGKAWKLSAGLGTPSSYGYFVTHRNLMTPETYAENRRTIAEQILAERSAFSHNVYVASCEDLYHLCDGDRDAIEWLRDQLVPIFGQVRVVVYLREQVSFLQSVYAQKVKGTGRYGRSYNQFVSALHNMRPVWDYANTVNLWADVFGDIDVSIYDKKALKNGNVVEDFFTKLGIDDGSLSGQQQERSNVSPGFRYLQALRMANALGVSSGRSKRWMPNALKNDKSPFPKKHDQKILRLVSKGNAFLNEAYLASSPVKLPVSSD